MIIINYLKPYNCVQTNKNFQTEIITWNNIIVSINEK